MYYSLIGTLAILILLIENQDVLFNRHGAFGAPAWKVYRRFLAAVLLYDVTDILWGLIESRKLSRLLFIDTSVYFLTMAAGILFWAQYAVTYLGEEKHIFARFLMVGGRCMAGLITLCTVVNLFVPLLFTVDEACVYHALPTRYVVMILQIILLLLISIFALCIYLRRHGISRLRFRTLALFGIIMAVFLTAQLWHPYLPLYAIAYMLGTCLLRAFVIGDEKEAYRLELQETAKIHALKQSISSLLDNMPAMSYSKDAETGVYLACNQAFAAYAQKPTPEDVIGLTDAQIFDPTTADHFAEDDRMALSMDEPYIFFEDVLDAAGSPRQLQTTKLKFIDASGRLCTLGMSQDVTDFVRIQREHATTKEAYEQARSTGIMYTRIAQTLARGYTMLYYINLDTEEFIEYHTNKNGTLSKGRHGQRFFDMCKADVKRFVYPEDRDLVEHAMERRTLLETLDRNETFMMTYRLQGNGEPTYASMKVSRMEDDEHFIIIGVTDVDEQMKQQQVAERVKEERAAYARLTALTGDLICVYIVDPETGSYREYSASEGFEAFAIAKEGADFFSTTREQSRKHVYPEDLDRFLSMCNKEDVLSEIGRHGIFLLSYRLVIDGKPTYVQFKAAMVNEAEGERLIIGVNDIDAQVREEKRYEQRLAQAQNKARIDALTGIKNKFAYLDAEEQLNRQIAEQSQPAFSIVILDVNDLKIVNDLAGHQAGDQYLRDASKIICDIFKHSPVFRIGGDEFAVISQGTDYANIEELVGRVNDHNTEAFGSGGVIIACGMARYDSDESVASVFARADQNMYENKNVLKTKKKS